MGLLSLFKSKSAPAGQPGESEPAGPFMAAPAAEPEERLAWRKTDFFFVPAGDEQHLVAARGRRPFAMPAFAVDFLLHCEEFQPLEGHLSKYAGDRDWSELQLNALTSWLPKMKEAGLLISSAQVRSLCAATRDPGNQPPKIEVIGIPTGGNRTEMLERCIRSFAGNLQRHERAAEIFVADSSASPEPQAAFRALLSRLNREEGWALRYAGEEEKRRYAAALVERSGCRTSSVEFALFDPLKAGFACGANRNALLLHEAGKMTVSVDDDVLCDMAPIEHGDARVALFAGGDPCHREFFADRESAVAAANFQDRDFLGAHETMLGQDIGVLFPADLQPSEIDLSSADDHILRRIEEKSARLRTTYFGQLGDPGTPTSCYYFYLKGENLARLTASEELYRGAFLSRSVLAGVPTPSVGGGYLAPGMTIGFDHRELLPPFFPVLHAEDMIFAASMAQCCFRSVAGHLPIALHHDSGSKKVILQPGDLNSKNRATVFEFAPMVRAILNACAPNEHEDVAERMRMLGRNVSAFAARPPADFLDALHRVVLQLEGDKLSFLENLLRSETEAPDFWREDLERYIAHSREALEHDDFDIPYELKGQRSDDENRRLMQQLLASYGALLEDWPAIVQAARELREEGFVFSTAIQ